MKTRELMMVTLLAAALGGSACPKQTETTTEAAPAKTSPARPVRVADINLEAALRAKLGKSAGELTDVDLAGLTSFDATGRSITSLAGMEHCVNLASLELGGNQVRDLGPLAGLTRLKRLTLAGNFVDDISPLAKLIELTYLDLSFNRIEDLTPLAGLIKLQTLNLAGNRVSDLTPLVKNARAGGIGPGDALILSGNPLDNNAQLKDVPGLVSGGVRVEL